MEEIDIKDLSTELLEQKLETLEYDLEKISASYVNEIAEKCKEKKITESNNKSNKIVNKIAKKYSEYLIPITLEMEDIELELARRRGEIE